MSKQKRAERLQIMLTRAEVRALEAWRFDNSMPSRSAAARALMNLGLHTAASPAAQEALLAGDLSSGDVGLVDNPDATVVANDDARSILVVDEEPLVGRGIGWVVRQAGFLTLGPAISLDEASSLLQNHSPPAAVVTDVKVGGQTAERFADELASRHIPFLFCTAYPVREVLPERLWRSPMVSKQSAPSSLPGTLATLLNELPSGDQAG